MKHTHVVNRLPPKCPREAKPLELGECRDLYAKTKIVRPGGSSVDTGNRDVLGQSATGCKTSCDFSVESYSDDSTALKKCAGYKV